MENFIKSIPVVCEDIISQLINQDIKKEKISFEKQLELKDSIAVITSIRSKKNSFQIIVNFSEDLAKSISSLVNGGVPVVIMDNQAKQIIMEISKLIIANSIIYLEDYDERCLPSPPCLVESKNIIYNTDEAMTTLKFKLMNEPLTIAIVTVDER